MTEKFKEMLDNMSHDDIEQLRKELKGYKSPSHKKGLCNEGIAKIEATFSDRKLKIPGIYADDETIKAMYIICDHVTSNYAVSTRYSYRMKPDDIRYVHDGNVSAERQDTFEKTFNEIAEVIVKNKMPFKLPSKES